MTKKKRLDLILDLIEKEEISTQEELTERLNSLGFAVSQATVSRDINELNLLKVKGQDKKIKFVRFTPKTQEIDEKILNIYRHVVVSVESAKNLIVIKTLAGNGGSMGMAVDAMHFPEVLGSVAGDDTLLVITKTSEDAEIIVKCLRSLNAE